MIKLIKIELKKILHKKSLTIILGIMVIFCLLNNILYWLDYDEEGIYQIKEETALKQEETDLEAKLKKYEKEHQPKDSTYITLKTKLDLIGLKKEFSSTSWQYKKIDAYLYDITYQKNDSKYLKNNPETIQIIEEQYQTIITKLKKDDWKYFLYQEEELLNDTKKNLNLQLQDIEDSQEKDQLNQQLTTIQLQLKILKMRLDYQIKEEDSYLNSALENYQKNSQIVLEYQNLKRNYDQNQNYQTAVKEMKLSKYILETKQNINQPNNLNYQLRTIVEDYEIFFVLLILIISGTILTDEFREGTIKLLLIKPYSRGKILLSKYIASILVLGFSIGFLIILQLLIGGIIFGFDSLSQPVVVYHLEKSKIIAYPIFSYMGIRILSRLPFLVMMITLAMFLGIISNNSMTAITIPLILYILGPSLSTLMAQYQLEWMKFLVNVNWNLQDYLFGNQSSTEFLSYHFSLIVLGIYWIFLLGLSLRIFKRKNIKNV